MNNNVSRGSIVEGTNEPFTARLKQLMNGRSIKQASDAWGVNVSTLKNYFSRQNSKPRYEALTKISQAEGVSVDWLIGKDSIKSDSAVKLNPNEANKDNPLFGLMQMLSDQEQIDLYRLLARKGIETALLLLDEDMVKLAQARPAVKKAALMLNDLPDAKVREILAEIEGAERTQPESLTRKTG